MTNKRSYLTLATPLGVTIYNLMLAYVVYFLARILYFGINHTFFPTDMSYAHMLELFLGGLVFDTSAISHHQQPLHRAYVAALARQGDNHLSESMSLGVRRDQWSVIVHQPLRCRLFPLYDAPHHDYHLQRVLQRG